MQCNSAEMHSIDKVLKRPITLFDKIVFLCSFIMDGCRTTIMTVTKGLNFRNYTNGY